MFILELRLDGNTTLDVDPNCKNFIDKKKEEKTNFDSFLDRQHVLDCLPRIWMFDGIFISSELK